jgi:uncharacterized integral membrane protein (TIGR00698 family)
MGNLSLLWKKSGSIIPGLLLAIAIASLSQLIHSVIIIGGQKPVSSVLIAILIGILLKNTIGIGATFMVGVNFVLKKMLKGAIILLGLGLSFMAVITIGGKALIIIITTVTVAILLTYSIGKKMGVPDKLAALIGVGTAICGTTAIVASVPAIRARDEEVTFSVATITIFGVLAIFIYPILGKVLALTDIQFGTWAGVAIHETAQVVAAGFSYSDPAGKIATVVKLTRTVFLAPIVLLLGIAYVKNNKEEKSHKVSYLSIFPWFVVGFLAMAGLRTIGDNIWSNSNIWVAFLSQASIVAKYLIVTAMAGVGLMTDFDQMKKVGFKPFVVGLVASLIMAVFSIVLIFTLGIY